MKNLRSVVGAVALATIVSQPVLAADPAPEDQALANAFGGGAAAVQVLERQELEQTSGKLAPLMLPLTIAAVDLALIGTFWGIYLPYTSHGPCHYCVQP